jgi:hypothetical protein
MAGVAHITSAEVGLAVGGLGFVAAIVSNIITWRVSGSTTRAAHAAWLREKRSDSYLEMLAAISLREGRRHSGDATTTSQTLLSATAFGSPEVRSLFEAAKDLDKPWIDLHKLLVTPGTTYPAARYLELSQAKDAVTIAESKVVERIRIELAEFGEK